MPKSFGKSIRWVKILCSCKKGMNYKEIVSFTEFFFKGQLAIVSFKRHVYAQEILMVMRTFRFNHFTSLFCDLLYTLDIYHLNNTRKFI